jgi:hypothetical protein
MVCRSTDGKQLVCFRQNLLELLAGALKEEGGVINVALLVGFMTLRNAKLVTELLECGGEKHLRLDLCLLGTPANKYQVVALAVAGHVAEVNNSEAGFCLRGHLGEEVGEDTGLKVILDGTGLNLGRTGCELLGSTRELRSDGDGRGSLPLVSYIKHYSTPTPFNKKNEINTIDLKILFKPS